MKKEKKIVAGSIDELINVVSAEGKGDIRELFAAFPEHVHCHHTKSFFPKVMAKVATPYHTKHITHAQHLVCEVDCGRKCQQVESSVSQDEIFEANQALKIRSNNVLSRAEMLAAGQFVPASEGLYL